MTEQTKLIRMHKHTNDFTILLENLINDNVSFENKLLYIDTSRLTPKEKSNLYDTTKQTNYKVLEIQDLDITKEQEFIEYITEEKFVDALNFNYFKNTTKDDLYLVVVATILYFKKNFILLSNNERFNTIKYSPYVYDSFIAHFKKMFVEHEPERYPDMLLDDVFTMCVNLHKKSIFETDGVFLHVIDDSLFRNLDRVFYNNTVHIFPTYSYLHFTNDNSATFL